MVIRGVAFAVMIGTSTLALAQVPDHLKCYPIKDSAPKAQYVADLDGLSPQTGCRIKVPAKMLCVETSKQNVNPPAPGGGPSGTPAGDFACYKVKCPHGVLPPVYVTDQFGSRMVTPKPAKLVCVPASVTSSPTTTTTPTTCGQLIHCCFAGMCQLGCSLACPLPMPCTIGSACGSFTGSSRAAP